MPSTRTLLPTCAVAVLIILNQLAIAQGGNSPAPVAYASASELNSILNQVQQTSQNIQTDLGKTRIEKWKLDSAIKRDLQGNADSILKNLQTALPEIVAQLNNSPEDL